MGPEFESPAGHQNIQAPQRVPVCFDFSGDSNRPMPQSGGLWLAAGLDGGNTFIFSEGENVTNLRRVTKNRQAHLWACRFKLYPVKWPRRIGSRIVGVYSETSRNRSRIHSFAKYRILSRMMTGFHSPHPSHKSGTLENRNFPSGSWVPVILFQHSRFQTEFSHSPHL